MCVCWVCWWRVTIGFFEVSLAEEEKTTFRALCGKMWKKNYNNATMDLTFPWFHRLLWGPFVYIKYIYIFRSHHAEQMLYNVWFTRSGCSVFTEFYRREIEDNRTQVCKTTRTINYINHPFYNINFLRKLWHFVSVARVTLLIISSSETTYSVGSLTHCSKMGEIRFSLSELVSQYRKCILIMRTDEPPGPTYQPTIMMISRT